MTKPRFAKRWACVWAVAAVLTKSATTLTMVTILLVGTWLKLVGLASVGDISGFTHIGKLDGDVELSPDYFERILTLLVDGLARERTPTPMAADPLDAAQFDAIMSRHRR